MPSVAVASVICTDYLIVGARGTDQPITGDARGLGPEVDDFASSFENLAVSADETVATEAVVYPAVGIPGDGPIRISNSRAFGEMVAFYSTSVSTGASEVERMVEEHEDECPQTQYILAGYSQGADVVAEGAELLGGTSAAAKIAGVAAFGDPLFNPMDSAAASGSFDPSRAGIFRPRHPWSDVTSAPVVSICREGDFFCQMRRETTWPRGETTYVVDESAIYDWAETHHGYAKWPGLLDPQNAE